MADPLKKEREATIKALKTIIEDNQKILEANQAGTEEFKKAAAENKKANAERKSLEKQQITLGKDLTKNFQDIGTTITGGLEGMLGEAFGPLGGIASSLTVGFFKRSQERKKDLESNTIQIDSANQMVEELREGKTATKKIAEEVEEGTEGAAAGQEEELGGTAEALSSMSSLLEEQKDTTRAILGSRETAEEEEKESDRQHKELIDALKGLKVESVKDVADDGGFFAGLGTIASLLGGIALGLSAPGIFKISQLTTALDNFKTKFPKISDKVRTFFNFADEVPKIPSIADDAAKLTSKVETWADGTRRLVTRRGTQFVTHTKDLDAINDALKVASEGSDAAGDSSKVIARAQKFMGIELPGFMQKGVDKVDEAAKGADLAVDAAKMGGVASKVGSIAKFLTVGVAGRALALAGNPVFDAIAMGKDIFDIGSAMTDDDVTTAVQKEDLGAVLGGIIGGGIGFVLGGPAGAALGVGLGNMAGEFIGGMLDEPEILGAIANVRKGLTDEQTTLQAEIADMEKQLNDPENKMSDSMRALMEQQLKAAENRKKAVDDELTEMNTAIAEDEAKLAKIVEESQAIAAQKAKLEAQLEKAEDDGDTARIAFLEKQITITETAFDEAQTKYDTQADVLREKAQKSTGALSEASTSFFDRVASEGGFFGGLFSMFGGGLEGEAKNTYIQGQIDEISEKIAAQQALIAGGDLRDWKLRSREGIIKSLQAEQEGLKSQFATAARGAFIVNRPTYLPSSGVVVGEHASYSGRGAARGGIPMDGGPEAIVPLGSDRAGAFFDPIAQRMGENLNAQMLARNYREGGRGGAAPTNITDASTINNITNNTVIRTPSPSGPNLHFEGRDFVHKIA